ncbi:cadherin-like domain-containing protein [Pseudomonas stutzeri]|nr:cadherin-like domain-containing protein [Stutzerimonas stutzeri]
MKSASGVKVTVPSAFSTALPPVPLVTLAMLRLSPSSYTYTPPADFHGTDTVDYTVTDGSLTDTATLTLTVTPVNDAPLANYDMSSLASGASLTGVTVRVRVAVSVRLPSVTV